MDTISMKLSISPVKFAIKINDVFVYLKIVFILANSANRLIQHFIWVFTVCQSTCLPVSRM